MAFRRLVHLTGGEEGSRTGLTHSDSAWFHAAIALCAHRAHTVQLRNLSGRIPERGEYFVAMLTQEWGAMWRRPRRPGELHRSSHDCERLRDAGMFHLDDHVSGRDVLIVK
jgi:hypothetical protein